MVVSTLSAPVSNRTRRVSQQVSHVNGTHHAVQIDGDNDGQCNNVTPTPSRQRAKSARRAAADQVRADKAAATQPRQFTPAEAADIEAKVLAWEAAKERAQRCYGVMGALEDQMMEVMYASGEKSVRLADGRVVVMLDEFRDPTGATAVCADFIQVIPAGVIPE